MPIDVNGNWKDFSEDLMPDFSDIKRNTKDVDSFSSSLFSNLTSVSASASASSLPAKSRFCVNPLKQFGMKL